MGKFEIRKSKDNRLYFVLKARNGEIIAQSQMYKSKQGVLKGIRSTKKNVSSEAIVDNIEEVNLPSIVVDSPSAFHLIFSALGGMALGMLLTYAFMSW